jgi:STE24 endopeptidase
VDASSRIRVALPLLSTWAVADVGARLLTPAGYARAHPPADAGEHFSPAEIARGRSYEGPQRRLGVARAMIEGGVLAALSRLTRRRSARADDAAGGPGDPEPTPSAPEAGPGAVRTAIEGALVGSWLVVATSIAGLPLTALSRRRAVRVGLATQTWRGWGEDVLKALAIQTLFGAAGGAAVTSAARRWPEGWWLRAAGASLAAGAGLATLAPVLLDPVFNDFDPLPEGSLRRDVLELAGAAGVRVGEVFAVDASRRTNAANAYVTGLGPTKRVVLFDTLLDRYDRDEVRVVVAHELAHVRHHDVPRSLAFSALFAVPAARAAHEMGAALAPGAGGRPEALAALALAAGIVSLPIGLPAARMSRAIERRADAFALALTRAPAAFVSFERKISLQNVADVRPRRRLARLFSSHPPTMERIAAALASPA